MTVIDFQSYSWFFLKNDAEYFIDVYCNHSAFVFSLLIQLNQSEINEYHKNGKEFLSNFAKEIQYFALTKYAKRQVSSEIEKAVYNAIQLYNKNLH